MLLLLLVLLLKYDANSCTASLSLFFTHSQIDTYTYIYIRRNADSLVCEGLKFAGSITKHSDAFWDILWAQAVGCGRNTQQAVSQARRKRMWQIHRRALDPSSRIHRRRAA